MPGPSERKRLEDVEKARKAVAEKVVRFCERRRLRGDEAYPFTVRFAPTKAEYEKGRAGCGGEELAAFLSLLDETARVCVDLPWALSWIEDVAAQAQRPGGLARMRTRAGADVEDVCAAVRAYAAGDFRGCGVFCRRSPTATPNSSRIRWRPLLSRRLKQADFLSGPPSISTTSLPPWDFALKDTAL